MNKITKTILKILSEKSSDIDLETQRKITDLKKLDPLRIISKKVDREIYNDGYEVPIRIFFSSSEMEKQGENYSGKVLLFFHGGGWSDESINTYERVCVKLALYTKQMVIAVEYRKAPEFKFPIPLMDCYCVYKALYEGKLLKNINPDNITLIGDSAGGNLVSALTLMLKQKQEFIPKRQILIYPAVWNDYTESSPFLSVKENGKDYLLTAEKIEEYMSMYQSKPEDRLNPLFAPLLSEDLKNLPRTLIITAEFDPLRDEGEKYGLELQKAGNDVKIKRIKDVIHGYFSLGINFTQVKETLDIINEFLKED